MSESMHNVPEETREVEVSPERKRRPKRICKPKLGRHGRGLKRPYHSQVISTPSTIRLDRDFNHESP